MSTQFDNNNTGIISKNLRKEADTHPDVKGQITVEGVEYWLDGWQRQRNDGTGSFYSLRVKRKDAPAAAHKPAQKPAPRRAQENDEEIPF
jgi:hypothetical protein